jgi:hypothetical protein
MTNFAPDWFAIGAYFYSILNFPPISPWIAIGAYTDFPLTPFYAYPWNADGPL